jgi:hypothetical protein
MSQAIAKLLLQCRFAGLSLTVEGEALLVDFDGDRPSDHLIEEIRHRKPEVLAALRRAAPVINLSDRRSASIICIICRREIASPSAFWGGKPCHRACGETDFGEAKGRGDYAR